MQVNHIDNDLRTKLKESKTLADTILSFYVVFLKTDLLWTVGSPYTQKNVGYLNSANSGINYDENDPETESLDFTEKSWFSWEFRLNASFTVFVLGY